MAYIIGLAVLLFAGLIIGIVKKLFFLWIICLKFIIGAASTIIPQLSSIF